MTRRIVGHELSIKCPPDLAEAGGADLVRGGERAEQNSESHRYHKPNEATGSKKKRKFIGTSNDTQKKAKKNAVNFPIRPLYSVYQRPCDANRGIGFLNLSFSRRFGWGRSLPVATGGVLIPQLTTPLPLPAWLGNPIGIP